MKQFLLAVIFLSTATFASAQSFISLTDDQQNNASVSNGANYYFFVAPGESHSYYFKITNQTSISRDFQVEMVTLTQTAGSEEYYCLTPGLCYMPDSIINSGETPIGANGTINLETHFYAGTFGDCIYRFTIWDPNNSADSMQFILHYNISPTGVNSLSIENAVGNPYPNPSSDKITIGYNFGGPAAVTISNLLGETMAEINLSAAAGNFAFDVTTLAAGTYYCSFKTENGIVTRKFVVTK
ncbi:MAG TPA: T9SS type A sorting domain-containing protein [Bacteroidia bacterium]|nr:T9SS type A sorting domain-containing protein [Bacteroidia bacterium]